MDATTKTYHGSQARSLATKTHPPNIKQLDYPPTKKPRTTQAPEFHIEVNLAPTPGAGVPALQGTCVVSNSQFQQPGSASVPGPLRLEEVADCKQLGDSCSAPDPCPLGRKVHIPTACRTLLQMLSDCAMTGRVLSSHDVLTWMDTEHPEVEGYYIDSYSDFQAFGVDDAFDIMESKVCHLATFGHLGRAGAQRLRQYTQDSILIPLDLWATKPESYDSGMGSVDVEKVFKWRREVEPGYVEDIEDVEEIKEVKNEEVEEEVEEEKGGKSSDIEEVSSFDWRAINMGQWEEEI